VNVVVTYEWGLLVIIEGDTSAAVDARIEHEVRERAPREVFPEPSSKPELEAPVYLIGGARWRRGDASDLTVEYRDRPRRREDLSA
jgi:hypothetical protein